MDCSRRRSGFSRDPNPIPLILLKDLIEDRGCSRCRKMDRPCRRSGFSRDPYPIPLILLKDLIEDRG